MNKKKVIGIIAIPLVFITILSGLKYGFISPMIKGVDIQIYGGSFITNLNKYVIKVGDKVGLSTGKYIVVPAFSKKPDLRFVILDNNGVLELEKNFLVAKKVGYSSIGILNKNRVLKKATIMVVNPTIKTLDFDLSRPLKHVGDKAQIIANVEIDNYKKLEKGYKLSYKSSDPNILKIEGNTVEAIGVGDAKISARYDRREIQTRLNIKPKIESIDIDKVYELEKKQSIQLHPIVSTLPKNSKVDIKYSIEDDDYAYPHPISIDDHGIVHAYKVGEYKVKISVGDSFAYTNIKVTPQSFKNIEIEHLQYLLNEKNSTNQIELGWDFDDMVNFYNIYMSKNNEDFRLISRLYAKSGSARNGNRVSEIINLGNDLNATYRLYVVGSKKRAINSELTKKSNTIIVDSLSKEFANNKVENIKYKVDKENDTIFLSWDNLEDCTYRVYKKNIIDGKESFVLLQNNIKTNNTQIKVNEDRVKAEFYVVAISKHGQLSNFSTPIAIDALFPY